MTDPNALISNKEHLPFAKASARHRLGTAFGLAAAAAAAGSLSVAITLWHLDRTPREWAEQLHRPNPIPGLNAVNALAASYLTYIDRPRREQPAELPPSLGAAPGRFGETPSGNLRPVASLQALTEAAATAQPGDVIQIQPGTYRFAGTAIHFSRPGTAAAPITVRAARLGDVVIESDAIETLKVTAPFWHFENLSLRGICADHTGCERAFHIVAGASDTVVRNNLMVDYNAHIKINGENGQWPDHGIVEGNTLTDTAPRVTANPIAPVDLVGASNWVIRGNIIADFIRAPDQGGEPPYGGFVKGEGENNVLERNLVLCEWKLRTVPGERVGLSLGGGGTDMASRRHQGRTGLEQTGGIIRDNLVAFCSDDGIYVNRAARSAVDHNTLLDTAGIDVRFIESSSTVTNNIIDGAIRTRNGAALQSADNARPFLPGLFIGLHPQRTYFNDPATLDLAWRHQPANLPDTEPRPDLCNRQRPANAPPGAFADYAACLSSQ
jgi:hypothetical protein